MFALSVGLSAALFIAWLILTVNLLKAKVTRFRGLLKHYTNGEYSEQQGTLKLWFLITALLSIVPCIWVSYYSWATDYSFLIGLFPIVWYYFLTRFVMFEKADLI